MGGLYLACCMKGLEVTRHYTPFLGGTIVLMLAAATAVGGVVLIAAPLLSRKVVSA